MPRVYIANGLGFGAMTRIRVLSEIVETLHAMGVDTIEPFADNNEASLSYDRSIAREHEIARLDMQGVRDADAVLCVVSAPIPDEGAMIEVGMAMALFKPVFILNDDFRFHNLTHFPMNLMLFGGMPLEEWKSYYYTSLESLSNPDMALGKWIESQKKS